MERASANALALAELLSAREEVVGVRYPGLPGDPAHEVARRQMTGFGSVIAFDLGSRERAERFLAAAELVTEATSFGSVHTTAERRAALGQRRRARGLHPPVRRLRGDRRPGGGRGARAGRDVDLGALPEPRGDRTRALLELVDSTSGRLHAAAADRLSRAELARMLSGSECARRRSRVRASAPARLLAGARSRAADCCARVCEAHAKY